MTSTAYAGSGQASVSTGRVLARTCGAEWTRLWTVRATWWLLAAAAVTMVGIGATLGLEVSNDPLSDDKPAAWVASAISSVPAQFALLTMVLLAVTSDYATAGIVPSLQWTPRRGVLLAARTFVPVIVSTTTGVVLAVGASLAAWATSTGRLELPVALGMTTIGWIALVLAAGGTMTVGLGFVLRSTAGGLICVFLLMLVLPLLLPAFGLDWLTTLAGILPGTGAVFLLLEGGVVDMTTSRAVIVLIAWAATAVILGGLRLVRADADR